MALTSRYRMGRIEQVKILMLENPQLNRKEIILLAMSKFGFSERLVKEYLGIIDFEATWQKSK